MMKPVEAKHVLQESSGTSVPQPELETWLCPVHQSLDDSRKLEPLDNCVACIRAERNELRKDKERLDWLEKCGTTGIELQGVIGSHYEIEPDDLDGPLGVGESLREAIDVAMEEGE